MSIHYVRELPDECYVLLEDQRVMISQAAFNAIGDYTRSQPTGPSAGRIYRKNFGWPEDMDDNWFLFICEEGTGPDEGYVLHVPHGVIFSDSLELISEEPV